MTSDDTARLGAGKYVLVTSFRKDGTGVPTPVWVAEEGGELVVWTAARSGKVKRIRRDPSVEVAPCDVRGNPSGPAVPGTARVLDAERSEHARSLIRRKYGVAGFLVVLGSRLRRGSAGTVGVAIALGGDAPGEPE